MTTIKTPGATYRASFDLGDVVFHRAASEEERGIITGIALAPHGVYYWVTWPDRSECRCFELELCREFSPDYATPG